MNVIFTDLFEQQCQEKFQIGKPQVWKTITDPDARKIVQLDDLTLGFFVKNETWRNHGFYLLVCARNANNNWIVDLAFRVHPTLAKSVGSLEPLLLLQSLAQQFGLAIRIADQLNRFIFREVIPIERYDNNLIRLVEVVNPLDHSCIQSLYIKVEEQGPSKVPNVALAYCIDVEEYLAWLLQEESREKHENVAVELAPQMRGLVTPRDLITPSGTIEFQSNYSQMGGYKTGVLFRLSSRDYHLEVGFTNSDFYMIRNGQRLHWLLEPVFRPQGHVHCFATWAPTQLSLLILEPVMHFVP